MYTSVFSGDPPTLLEELAHTPAMARLAGVGMHCGVDYTGFPAYRKARGPYTRWTHSVGVARIVWHFTRDLKQAVAGLLHDISTPVFAHTIDFLNNDHMSQESTESGTREIIEASEEIMALLEGNGLEVGQVWDYHLYPVADNDTPMLSADRLEYSLGNAYLVYHTPLAEIRWLYEDLCVAENERGSPELAFQTLEAAARFTEITLANSHFFVSDEDRFAMQFLADTVRHALDKGVLSSGDLHTTEREVIGKLKGDPETAELWNSYVGTVGVETSGRRVEGRYCVRVQAKKRYINPLVRQGNAVRRILERDARLRGEMDAFLNLSFDRWLCGVPG